MCKYCMVQFYRTFNRASEHRFVQYLTTTCFLKGSKRVVETGHFLTLSLNKYSLKVYMDIQEAKQALEYLFDSSDTDKELRCKFTSAYYQILPNMKQQLVLLFGYENRNPISRRIELYDREEGIFAMEAIELYLNDKNKKPSSRERLMSKEDKEKEAWGTNETTSNS